MWDKISTKEELEEALADASVEKNVDLNNSYNEDEPFEEQLNKAVDNAVDLTTAEENVVVIIDNIETPLEELTELHSAPNETEEERISRESREDLAIIIQEARINNKQEENRIEEEEEIEREIKGEIDEVVLRKQWEAQAEAEMEEDREELARNAKNITVNRAKAV